MILELIASVIIGSIAGIVYGLSFVAQQKRVFSSPANQSKINTQALLFFLLRVLLLSIAGYYLLRLSSNQIILNILISFVISFWLTILKK